MEILVLYDVRLVRATLEFLRANDHLKKLSLTTLIAKDVLENKVRFLSCILVIMFAKEILF